MEQAAGAAALPGKEQGEGHGGGSGMQRGVGEATCPRGEFKCPNRNNNNN